MTLVDVGVVGCSVSFVGVVMAIRVFEYRRLNCDLRVIAALLPVIGLACSLYSYHFWRM